MVNDQWAAHLDMMAHKDHYVTATYRAKWEGMVRAAQPALAAYRGAVDTLSHAPACSRRLGAKHAAAESLRCPGRGRGDGPHRPWRRRALTG